jgi:hypothetical protein
MSAALTVTLTPTPRRIAAITRLIEVIVARLQERTTGAQMTPPVGEDYNVDAEAEHLISWMSGEGWPDAEEADTLCDEGEWGNEGESFD